MTGKRMSKGVRGLSQLGTAAGLACLAIAVAGPANADDLNTTTCSGQQVMSSLQQNDPVIWGKINSNPQQEQELLQRIHQLLTLARRRG
ncbi:MAG: hypothetical protein WCI78_14350, partial [Mycobacterium sp.]